MKSILSHSLIFLCLVILLSCNIYAPLNSKSSDLDKLEEAQKCLSTNDYSCAIEQYKKISESELKHQKLCQAYLSKGGISLKILDEDINQNSGRMLSRLALSIVPWTLSKSADFDSAKNHCDSYASAKPNEPLAVLLKTVASLSRCAVRMARAHLFQGTSDSDTVCNFPPTQLGATLIKQDIYTLSDPNGYPGMCRSDVITCYDDLKAVPSSVLTAAGFTQLSGAVSLLQSQLPDTQAQTTATRLVLYGTFP